MKPGLSSYTKPGLIVCGYQGIGKSTAARTNTECKPFRGVIDLESSSFWVDGKRPDDWVEIYVNIAEHLADQNYLVFTSSHKGVREELLKRDVPKMTAYPSLELKSQWIAMLEQRYLGYGSDKNYKAWVNAKDTFEENIADLATQEGFMHFCLGGKRDELPDGGCALVGEDIRISQEFLVSDIIVRYNWYLRGPKKTYEIAR